MSSGTDCDRVRLLLMAALDGETVQDVGGSGPDARQHLAVCPPCSEWLRDLELMNIRFQRVTYPDAQVDLWATVERTIRHTDDKRPVTHRIWLIAALVFAWRALQLSIDLPLPVLHPLVPLGAALAALWLIARDPLAIETSPPELQKRGI